MAIIGCAGALALAPGIAQADSIAYIKGGNVWLSTADGSHQFQVTSSGDYSDVSQADDGTMIALSGVRLRKLDRQGNVLADFATPVSDTRPAPDRTSYGPFDPAISPDGSKVAYTYDTIPAGSSPDCLPPGCLFSVTDAGTGYTRSGQSTPWSEPGFAPYDGWRHPVWVDDATTVLSDPTDPLAIDVLIDTPGDRSQGLKAWFGDMVGGNRGVGGGDITRDHRKLAFATGVNGSTLTVYRVPAFPTEFPGGGAPYEDDAQPCYRYSDPEGGSFGAPTFSPDGTRLAVAEGNGINVATVPDLSVGCTTDGASPETQLLIPGATQPDWGPADVPGASPTATTPSPTTSTPAPKTPSPTPLPAPSPSPSPSPVPVPCGSACPSGPPSAHVAVRAARLAAVLRGGLEVTVTGERAGAIVRLVGRSAGRVIARGAGRADRAGRAVVRLRVTASARRTLRRTRRIAMTVSGAGAAATVTLRR